MKGGCLLLCFPIRLWEAWWEAGCNHFSNGDLPRPGLTWTGDGLRLLGFWHKQKSSSLRATLLPQWRSDMAYLLLHVEECRLQQLRNEILEMQAESGTTESSAPNLFICPQCPFYWRYHQPIELIYLETWEISFILSHPLSSSLEE